MRKAIRLLSPKAAFLIITTAGIFSLGGCALPAHNNTMIFAVKRDIGIGISTPSAADQSLNATIGYRERQAAWVPLWANEKTGMTSATAIACGESSPNEGERKNGEKVVYRSCKNGPKFVGDSDANKGNNDAHDAYSTFASFGGDLAAGNDTGGKTTNVSGKLASFFATGVAAQYLAKQTGIVSDVFKSKQGEDPAKKTSPQSKQLNSIKEFLERTKDESVADAKVRVSCVKYLQAKALLDDTASKALEKLPKATVITWTDALDENEALKQDIPMLARVAQRGIDEMEKKLDSQNEGRAKINQEFCGT